MAQNLSDIYSSLNSAYNPQRDVYQQQYNAVDGQTQAQVQGLNTQKDNAFHDITNQANANGMYYSGAPVSEEQKYTGGTYMPALANLQAGAQNQKFGLQQAIAGVGVNQTNQANSLYQNQLAQDQAQKNFQQTYAQTAQYNQQQLDLTRANNRSLYTPAAAPAPNQQQLLAAAFQSYDPKNTWQTERTIAPSLAAALGIDYGKAKSMALDYRKQVYGN